MTKELPQAKINIMTCLATDESPMYVLIDDTEWDDISSANEPWEWIANSPTHLAFSVDSLDLLFKRMKENNWTLGNEDTCWRY